MAMKALTYELQATGCRENSREADDSKPRSQSASFSVSLAAVAQYCCYYYYYYYYYYYCYYSSRS